MQKLKESQLLFLPFLINKGFLVIPYLLIVYFRDIFGITLLVPFIILSEQVNRLNLSYQLNFKNRRHHYLLLIVLLTAFILLLTALILPSISNLGFANILLVLLTILVPILILVQYLMPNLSHRPSKQVRLLVFTSGVVSNYLFLFLPIYIHLSLNTSSLINKVYLPLLIGTGIGLLFYKYFLVNNSHDLTYILLICLLISLIILFMYRETSFLIALVAFQRFIYDRWLTKVVLHAELLYKSTLQISSGMFHQAVLFTLAFLSLIYSHQPTAVLIQMLSQTSPTPTLLNIINPIHICLNIGIGVLILITITNNYYQLK